VTAFLAILNDVPRRIRTSWVFWILLVLVLLVVGFFAISICVRTGDNGTVMTWWGEELQDVNDQGHFVHVDVTDEAPRFAGGFLGVFCACYVGVFAGLVLLADSVSSAFGPGSAEINVPKPVHRATILVARHVGALAVASFYASVLLGGGLLVVYLRTGVLVPKLLAYIPISVAIFAVLHAIGTIASVAIQNALLGAFASVGIWLVAVASGTGTWEIFRQLEKGSPLAEKVLTTVRIIHRVLPRPTDLPALGERILTHQFGAEPTAALLQALRPGETPLGTLGEFELIANSLVWWVLGLIVASLVIRRRDF
jgi:ABC-type transport system involved in multi-copper enzyme maturation permease subunit